MRLKNIFFLSFIFLSILQNLSGQQKIDYGLKVYKKANCMGCHKWHGDGGPGYGGAAMSLRTTGLDREGLKLLIACGRPGTNMPFFDKKAYVDDRCFGLKFEDFKCDEKNRPLRAKALLNKRQIDQLTDFIINDLKGKQLDKEFCVKFFGKPTRSCENL